MVSFYIYLFDSISQPIMIQTQVFTQLIAHYQQKFRIQLKIRNANAVGGGCISSSLKLETNQGNLFLKWNTNGPVDLFVREAESLTALQKSKNEFIHFPTPLLTNEVSHQPGYLLTTFLEQGRSGNDDEKLGRGLAQLHKITNNTFGFEHNNYCGASLQNNHFNNNWVAFYSENRIGHLLSLIRRNRHWSEDDEKLAGRFLKKIPDLLSHQPVPSLIHGDLWCGNYLYTLAGPALIDPCACFCDREFEMGIMTLFGGFSQTVYDAYNEIYPLPDGWLDRNQIYQLYHVLNHYFLFGGSYKSQALEIMRRYC